MSEPATRRDWLVAAAPLFVALVGGAAYQLSWTSVRRWIDSTSRDLRIFSLAMESHRAFRMLCFAAVCAVVLVVFIGARAALAKRGHEGDDRRSRLAVVGASVVGAIALGLAAFQAWRWSATFYAFASAAPVARLQMMTFTSDAMRPIAALAIAASVVAAVAVVGARGGARMIAGGVALTTASLVSGLPVASWNTRMRLDRAVQVDWPPDIEAITVAYDADRVLDFGTPVFLSHTMGCGEIIERVRSASTRAPYPAMAVDRRMSAAQLRCLVDFGADDALLWLIRGNLPTGDTLETALPMRLDRTVAALPQKQRVHVHVTRVGWSLNDRGTVVRSDWNELGIRSDIPFPDDLKAIGANGPPVVFTADPDVSANRFLGIVAHARLRVPVYVSGELNDGT